jgi:hypothetical protein
MYFYGEHFWFSSKWIHLYINLNYTWWKCVFLSSYCDQINIPVVDWTRIALATANIQTNDLAALPCGPSRLAWSNINRAHLNFQHTWLAKRWIDSIASTGKKRIYTNPFVWIIQRCKQKPHRSTHAHCVCILLRALVYTKASAEIVVASRKRKNRSPRVVFICAPGVEIWREWPWLHTLILHHFGNYFLPKRGRRKSRVWRGQNLIRV